MRPSHTVRTGLPIAIGDGDAVARRLLRGAPVIVHGDGRSLWTLTRSADLAVPFVRLLGNGQALGEDFHITNDRAFTWDEITHAIAAGLGVKAKIVHVPTDTLVRYNPDWEGPLTGDKSLVGAVRQLQGQARRRRFHLRRGPADDPRGVDRPLQRRAMRWWLGAAHELDPLMDRIAAAQEALGG